MSQANNSVVSTDAMKSDKKLNSALYLKQASPRLTDVSDELMNFHTSCASSNLSRLQRSLVSLKPYFLVCRPLIQTYVRFCFFILPLNPKIML